LWNKDFISYSVAQPNKVEIFLGNEVKGEIKPFFPKSFLLHSNEKE
jgi:hypothetical protein